MALQHKISRISAKSKRSAPLQKALIWSMFTVGTLITILAIAAIGRFERGTSDRHEAIASLVLFGLVPLAGGSGLAWNHHRHTRQVERDRLQTVFYTMVQEGRGRMSVLAFALEAEISGTAARTFLDTQSQAFQVQFDVTDQGEIVYRFDLCRV